MSPLKDNLIIDGRSEATFGLVVRNIELDLIDLWYIHPFRHPSYHATQLRAIVFAKSNNRRLLWVIAYDKITDKTTTNCSKIKEEDRKERWLEFHDRFTGGVPGLLPLAIDLPIRFTEQIDKRSREQGVFKHARGIVRDWQLPEAETLRLAKTEEPEIVLKTFPLKLYIEMPNATKAMPMINGKRIFVLTVQVKPWSLNNGALKIQRFGFPIVPDFGGTAHAYCGSTMDAALGDCLSWWQKPNLEQMLRAYIIKSRIKESQHLKITQAYSPHLFRQGLLPGPSLLLDVLQNKITTEQAKEEWTRHEKEKQKRPEIGGGQWITRQTLPCRVCTDKNNGKEIWRPLSYFNHSERPDILLETLRKGSDLVCQPCRVELEWESADTSMMACGSCQQLMADCNFPLEARDLWKKLDRHNINCLRCLGYRKKQFKLKCNGRCQTEMPKEHFVEAMVADWFATGTMDSAARCARCIIAEEVAGAEIYKCRKCFKQKALKDFAWWPCKQFLSTNTKVRGAQTLIWYCYDCQHPPCLSCGGRPVTAAPPNAFADENAKAPHGPGYYCRDCKYPECNVFQADGNRCSHKRTESEKHSKKRFQDTIKKDSPL